MPILVTTALEDLDYTNQDLLFLGEWCKKHLTKEDLNKDIGLTAPYHWDDREKLYNDYKYIKELCEKKLYPAITTELNKFHNVNYSIRYWKIILGPWLTSFITCLLDRWDMIEFASREYDIDYILLDKSCKGIVAKDMIDFKKISVDDTWNNYIYREITSKWITLNSVHKPLSNSPKVNTGLKDRFKSKLKYLRSKIYDIASFFARNNTIVFFDSYMPNIAQWKIESKLGQVPSVRFSHYHNSVSAQYSYIERVKISLDFHIDNKFEQFVRHILPKQIPIAFCEGYLDLVQQSNSYLFPKLPTIIFTSNAHFTNDIFNVWSAKNTEKGSKLILAQHGGGYGTMLFSLNLYHEISIADNFLTWGWSDNKNTSCTPLIATKFLAKYNECSYRDNDGILHVLGATSRYTNYLASFLISSQHLKYIYNQSIFINNINHCLVGKYTIRKNPNTQDWGMIGEIESKELTISYDTNKHFLKSLYSHKLIIITVNETTFLQALVSGIPVIAFWDPEFHELRDYAIADFNGLHDVGILHDTPESASEYVNNIWNNISEWWEDENVQIMRYKFCQKYARTSSCSVDRFSMFFDTLNNNE